MSLFESAIGLLSPPECISCGTEGSSLCGKCSDRFIPAFGERCWRCNALSPGGRTCQSCRHTGSPGYVWIATDHDGLARDLVNYYKFGHNRVSSESIARIMAQTFRRYNPNFSEYLIMPIPTATSRIRQRGFGHSELLARKISRELGLKQANLLRRLDQTRQLGSTRENRLKQLNSSFAVKSPGLAAGRKILLIDDVVTTGGTIIAATQVLRAAGAAQIDALLFAKRL
jgi:ComF family protein